LAQPEFWKSLPGLKRLEIFLSPDWRREHVIGDRFHSTNMLIAPAKAAQSFTDFLRRYVTRIEHLHSLTIGYVGGGEHGVGMYARNQHVLPAPIVDDLVDFLHDRTVPWKHPPRITKFDHVRHLEFHNCWFSPFMLKDFMENSTDTSLHSLTLNSVSLTAYPITILREAPLVEPPFCPDPWMLEPVPHVATWCQVLECITPGATMRERKYEAGFREADAEEGAIPQRPFRGHVQSITLKSCGYVKITLPKDRHIATHRTFQVSHPIKHMDKGLEKRMERFSRPVADGSPETGTRRERGGEDVEVSKCIMISPSTPSGDPYPWLGTLTQRLHRGEKRLLEEAWGMTFGWPDNLDRFAAVEDGCLEGGTGRFSGIIQASPEQHLNDA